MCNMREIVRSTVWLGRYRLGRKNVFVKSSWQLRWFAKEGPLLPGGTLFHIKQALTILKSLIEFCVIGGKGMQRLSLRVKSIFFFEGFHYKTMRINRRLAIISLTNINKNRWCSSLAMRLIIVIIFLRTVIIINSTHVSVSCEPSFKRLSNIIERKR